MNELEKLNFTLKEKTAELERLKVDCFVLNPKIKQLCLEIETIKKQIEILENKEGN